MIWERLKKHIIEYIIKNHWGNTFILMLEHKVVRKNLRDRKKITKVMREMLNNMITYESVKAYTKETDDVLQRPIGFLVNNKIYNNAIEKLYNKLEGV